MVGDAVQVQGWWFLGVQYRFNEPGDFLIVSWCDPIHGQPGAFGLAGFDGSEVDKCVGVGADAAVNKVALPYCSRMRMFICAAVVLC